MAEHTPRITIDPTVAYGRPVIDGTTIQVAQVAERVINGQPVASVATYLRISRDAVLTCCWHYTLDLERSCHRTPRQAEVLELWGPWARRYPYARTAGDSHSDPPSLAPIRQAPYSALPPEALAAARQPFLSRSGSARNASSA